MPFIESPLPVIPEAQRDWPPVTSAMALNLTDIAAERTFYPNHESAKMNCPDCKAAVVGIADEFSRWAAQNVEPYDPQRDDIVADLGRQVVEGAGATKGHFSSLYLLMGRMCHGSRIVVTWLEETGRITDRFEIEKWFIHVIIDGVVDHMRIEARHLN
jgi:hypothetical protein